MAPLPRGGAGSCSRTRDYRDSALPAHLEQRNHAAARAAARLCANSGASLAAALTDVNRSADSSAGPLWALAAVATVLLLREARDLCVPIAIAVLLSFALAPVVRAMQRLRLPRIAAAALLLAGIGSVTVWGISAAGDTVASAIHDLPDTARQIRQRMQASDGNLLERVNRAAAELRRGVAGLQAPPRQVASSNAVASAVWSGSASAATLAGNIVVVLFLVFFFLATAATYRPRLVDLAAPHLVSVHEALMVIRIRSPARSSASCSFAWRPRPWSGSRRGWRFERSARRSRRCGERWPARSTRFPSSAR